ncbi:hypothetical protein EI94DRAFT_189027 [Lactarius quietus]|nr:hypothetical protein EI94DRAFT_189027 [Lactarius quietus]
MPSKQTGVDWVVLFTADHDAQDIVFAEKELAALEPLTNAIQDAEMCIDGMSKAHANYKHFENLLRSQGIESIVRRGKYGALGVDDARTPVSLCSTRVWIYTNLDVSLGLGDGLTDADPDPRRRRPRRPCYYACQALMAGRPMLGLIPSLASRRYG